jgi:hypothetical protein
MDQSPCVVLVPSGRVYDTGFEDAVAELSRRGYPVWRDRTSGPVADTRDWMIADCWRTDSRYLPAKAEVVSSQARGGDTAFASSSADRLLLGR